MFIFKETRAQKSFITAITCFCARANRVRISSNRAAPEICLNKTYLCSFRKAIVMGCGLYYVHKNEWVKPHTHCARVVSAWYLKEHFSSENANLRRFEWEKFFFNGHVGGHMCENGYSYRLFTKAYIEKALEKIKKRTKFRLVTHIRVFAMYIAFIFVQSTCNLQWDCGNQQKE